MFSFSTCEVPYEAVEAEFELRVHLRVQGLLHVVAGYERGQVRADYGHHGVIGRVSRRTTCSLDDAGPDAFLEHLHRSEVPGKESFLKVTAGGQPSENDHAAVVVGQVQSVIAVCKRKDPLGSLGEDIKVLFHIAWAENWHARWDDRCHQLVPGPVVWGEKYSLASRGDRPGHPGGLSGRVGGREI